MDRLKGKTAIITGANSGIGEATAKLFAQEGASVVLVARRAEQLKKVEDEIKAEGGIAISVSADVTKKAECINIFDVTMKTFGKVDILVNNAGIADKHLPITRLTDEWYEEVCAINQTSVFVMTREALKYMEPAGSGSIINVSSIGAVRGNSGLAYTAAKTAVIGMTKNVAIQFAGKGIRCNAVCPGPTPTPLNAPDKIATFDEEFASTCNRHMDMTVPFVNTMDQAYAMLYFATDEAKGVTGQVLTVDNGISL
ncbi:MAG: SDR family oxidoreductase [Clostridiales bacterium]|nr:SDR family oxidoreductase [Clostridiales bacterium]